MPSKFGVATQRTDVPQWLVDDVRAAGMRFGNYINPDLMAGDPFGLPCAGRLYFDKEIDKQLQYRGAKGADEYLALCAPRMAKCPWITWWRGLNEPDTSSPAALKSYAAFELRRIERLHALGLRAMSFDFGTGRPEREAGTADEVAKILAPVARATDARAYHEYGMRAMTLDGYHLLRYQELERWLSAYGVNVAPIFITECGIDFAGDPDDDGWRAQLHGDEAEYLRQLAAYDAALCADHRVVAATPFIWLHDGWPSFDITRSLSGRLREYMRAQGGGVPIPAHWDPAAPDVAAFETALAEDMQKFVVPHTRKTWFDVYARGRGWEGPMSDEHIRTVYGVRALAQVWYSPKDDLQHVVYARIDPRGYPIDASGKLVSWQAATRHVDRVN